ncbi:MAG: DNA alkylation repair protein [Oscillospiraceae bacterium]|nr:DNA alkylation repair protein [Oscillospiraceae bacterium]
MTIEERLRAVADPKNAVFVSKLVPHLPPECVLGCRTPDLKALAKSLDAEPDAVQEFLQTLPHSYFDENQLHAFLIARRRPFDACLAEVQRFLPYVDNWATCDQLSPAVFRREAERLLPAIRAWLQSPHPYTVRFGIGMLMQHFLDARFQPEYPEAVAAIRSEEYYVNMEIAWYFATALAKQPETILPYLTELRLPQWVHRKTIQKAIESRRIPDSTKSLLRELRAAGSV